MADKQIMLTSADGPADCNKNKIRVQKSKYNSFINTSSFLYLCWKDVLLIIEKITILFRTSSTPRLPSQYPPPIPSIHL